MKQTLKEIRGQLTNEISKQYKERYENEVNAYKTINQKLVVQNEKLCKECTERKYKIEELEDKVRGYEEWIERLQFFCNIPDEKREDAVKEYLTLKKMNEEMEDITRMMRPYFNMIMGGL